MIHQRRVSAVHKIVNVNDIICLDGFCVLGPATAIASLHGLYSFLLICLYTMQRVSKT